MKNSIRILLAVIFFSLTISGCNKNEFDDTVCGDFNNEPLFKEPGGKCYYINNKGIQVYVAESDCNCD